MHLINILERWTAPKAHLDLEKRQTTRTPTLTLPIPSSLDSVISSVVQATTKNDPTTTVSDNTPTTTPTTQATQPTTTNRPTTSAQTTSQPSSTNKPATTNAPSVSSTGTLITLTTTPPITQGTDIPTNSVSDAPSFSTSKTSAAAANKTGTGSSSNSGSSGSSVATAVGVVCGVVGGFAVIILAIFIWRRHHRRKQMERIGSMEELPRAPSPGPLSRSFTRGAGARQPIDDDDDFLTPMDTLPNTHRMDDWESNKSPQHSDTAMYDDKSVYAESVYHEDGDYNQNMHDHSHYPQAPPPAMIASNGRFYSGDFSSMGQSPTVGTAVSPLSGAAASPVNSGSAGGAIPTYSAMNKYAALSSPGLGAAVTSPSNTSPVYGVMPASQQRSAGGYRAHDSYDAGGYV